MPVLVKTILISVLLPAIYAGMASAQNGAVSLIKLDVPSGMHLVSDNGEIPASLHLFVQPGFRAYAAGVDDSGEQFAIRRILTDLRLQHKQKLAVVLNTGFLDDVRGPVTDLYTEMGISRSLAVRAGRFAAPFSEENRMPSRLLHVPERYTALTSLQRSGSFASQTGVMLSGNISRLNYALSAGYQDRVQGSRRRDVQAHFSYRFSPDLRYGLSVSYAGSAGRKIGIADHNGFILSEVSVNGSQYGVMGISEWFYRNWHTRGEIFLIRFDGTVQQGNTIDFYYGSYSELGYFFGNHRHLAVHRLTGRLEVSQFYGFRGNEGTTKRLYSLSLAHTWRMGKFITLQAGTVYNLPDRVAESEDSPYRNGTGLFHFMGLLSIGI
ncbi:MAG: hypothetical protein ACNA8K_14410 [Cyclonatronaceae bacterium]